MPTVDILDQPTVVEATNDVAVVAFTEANVTVEVPSPAPVVEFASSASGLIVAGTGLTGGGSLIGNVSLALSAASIASLAKAETAIQPGASVSTFLNDAGYLTAATVEGNFQPLSDDLTFISNLTTTVFGRSFLELADAAAARTLLGVYGTADVYTKAEVGALVTGFAAASHTHDNTDIVSVAWSKLTGIPTLFPPGAHTHLMADITDLNFTADHGGLTGLADDDHPQYHTDARGDARYSLLGHTHAYADAVHTHLWADITDKPLTFAPSSHTHLWVDITDKPLTFTPSSHTHLWADITDKPTTFAPAAHVHAAGDVTSGVFSTALLGTGTANSGTFLRGDGTWAGIPGGVTDHGALTGLADDDHTQYHTDARGDARYSLLGHTHDYAASSHTHSYLPLTGGSLTGSLYSPQFNVANGSIWSQGSDFKIEASGSNALAFATAGAVRTYLDTSGNWQITGSVLASGSFREGGTWLQDKYAPISHSHSYINSNTGDVTAGFQAWNLDEVGTAVLNPDTGWHYGWRIGHGSADTYYSVTFAVDFFADEVFFRRKQGGANQSWRQLWHTGNLNPSSYLPLSGGTVTGNLGLLGALVYGYGGALNANDYFTTGEYATLRLTHFTSISGGSSNVPETPNNANALLSLGKHSGGYTSQLFFPDSTNIWHRNQSAGAWGAWYKLFTTANAQSLWNDMLDATHGAYADFNAVGRYGPIYIQGTTNGPGTPGAAQYYSWSQGLGSNYTFAQYAAQFAIPRVPLGGHPVLSVRYRENGTWGAWGGVAATALRLGSGGISVDNGTQWRITTSYGYGDIGPANSGYFHFSTDRAAFYFGNSVEFGSIAVKYQKGQFFYHDTAGRSGSVGRGTAAPTGGSDGDIYFQYT